MDKDYIAGLLNKQRDFFYSGKTRDIDFRIEQLAELQKALISRENGILQALKRDLGKSEEEGYMSELGLVIAEINFMLKNLKYWARPVKVKTPLMFCGGSCFIYSEPLGTVLIIGPWNYPFQLMAMPLLGAMAAGNCIVLKPSELAPHTSVLLHEIIRDSFPEEYVAVIEGGVETSTILLEQKFDHIFFTGGTAVGRIVMQAAARNLTPVTLELGGKSPCIVDKDTDIKYTARRIVWGKFINAGQTCVAPDYLLVHEEIKGGLLEEMKRTISEFFGPDPRSSRDYSRIINDRHFMRLVELLAEGRVVCGGKFERETRYISPTIIEQISPDSLIMQDEIFGPILPVLPYSHLDEVIRFLHNKPKPLALYFFSRDKYRQEKVLRQTSSGGVCINDTLSHIINRELPFGGVGESGMGHYHGEASFKVFSHHKSVLRNTFAYDFPVKYPPCKLSRPIMKRLFKFL